MASYDASLTRADRAKAIAAVAFVYVTFVGLALTQSQPPITPTEDDPSLVQDIDIAAPPPEPPPSLALPPMPPDLPPLPPMPPLLPPLPPSEIPATIPELLAAAPAGAQAEPTPVVAPLPQIMLPVATPIPAAPVAGTGSSARAGAAATGIGTGAGGVGSGRGGVGGGGGGGGGGIGSDVRLLGGNRAKLPASLLRRFAADRGSAQLVLTIAVTGRVSNCSVLSSTGSGEVDQALCNVMLRQSRWQAARDLQGRPVSVKIRYTAIWSKN